MSDSSGAGQSKCKFGNL